MLDPDRVDRYLARLGVDRPAAPDVEALRALQRAHLATVPFENLSIHLGDEIVLDEVALVDKVVGARRGGFCFELNGAFAALLDALGYRVTRLEARVLDGDQLGVPFDHLCLRVDIDDEGDGDGAWLVDVGFGAAFAEPLRFDAEGPQTDPDGTFELRRRDDGWVDLIGDGTPRYRFHPAVRALIDFEPGRHHHTTSPDSHFTQGTVCTLRTASGRVTIAGRTLIETEAGTRAERDIDDDGELLALYRQRFGIDLAAVPTSPAPD
ncbi:MAG TPA: arylamine N-acetyltransferase [Acidimicrobiales bacterium]|nr:arylamine N-acetyltransferase [Acidimicrobiales bacterium]